MGGFVKDLRDRLEKASGQAAPWGDVNPLVVIGLTEAILDLGLTEDQLYATIRSYGRQLAAQVHPDRAPTNVSAERQKQILEAFDFLDGIGNFRKALVDFKTLRADDRREVRILGQAMSALRSQMFGLESQYEAFKVSKEQLAADQRTFNQLKREEALVIPGMEEELKFHRQEVQRRNEALVVARRSRSHWKKRFDHLATYFSSLENKLPENPLATFAFEARWVAVIGLSPRVGSSELSPLDEEGQIRSDFSEIALRAKVKPKQLTRMIENWKQALIQFGTPHKLETRILPLGFALVKLSAGKQQVLFGDRFFGEGGRVIGSFPPKDFSITRDTLRRTVHQETVFESLKPTLVPGNLLVSTQSHPPGKKAIWSTTCPAFVLRTKKVILAVG